MPIYEYECENCGKVFSFIEPVSRCSVPQTCSCGGMAKRIMSPVFMKSYIGSYQYNKINNYPPGTSASDYANGKNSTEDW
jgi:putative FmdB family regulatory protein